MSRSILKRWMTLRRGEGQVQARRVRRGLSLVAFLLFVAIAVGILRGGLPEWLLVALSIPNGWLLAERNALDQGKAQWLFGSQYIDWERVERDLESAGDK